MESLTTGRVRTPNLMPMWGHVGNSTFTTGGSLWWPLIGGGGVFSDGTSPRTPCSVPGKLSRFRWFVSRNDLVSPETVTITLRKNALPTSVQVVIDHDDDALVITDLVNTVDVAAGDQLDWEAVASALGANRVMRFNLAFAFEPRFVA